MDTRRARARHVPRRPRKRHKNTEGIFGSLHPASISDTSALDASTSSLAALACRAQEVSVEGRAQGVQYLTLRARSMGLGTNIQQGSTGLHGCGESDI